MLLLSPARVLRNYKGFVLTGTVAQPNETASLKFFNHQARCSVHIISLDGFRGAESLSSSGGIVLVSKES